MRVPELWAYTEAMIFPTYSSKTEHLHKPETDELVDWHDTPLVCHSTKYALSVTRVRCRHFKDYLLCLTPKFCLKRTLDRTAAPKKQKKTRNLEPHYLVLKNTDLQSSKASLHILTFMRIARWACLHSQYRRYTGSCRIRPVDPSTVSRHRVPCHDQNIYARCSPFSPRHFEGIALKRSVST